MKITFITHSSFLIESQDKALLFDYYGEGRIPETDKELIVLSSHSHADHYNRCIFTLEAKAYLLSDTIRLKEVPEEKRSITHRVHAKEKVEVEGISFTMYGSTDIGVSFLFRLEDKEIYFAGDNNIWYWDEEDEHFIEEFEANISGIRHCDIAFLPVDPRLGEHLMMGAEDFERLLHPDIIIPMHMWKDYSAGERAKASLKAEVLAAEAEGQSWEI